MVLSTIAWFDLASCWREPRSLAGRIAACAKFVLAANVPQVPSWRRDCITVVRLAAAQLVAEADQLVRYFGVSENKIQVVHNGADEQFAEADPRAFARRAGGFHFVLYPGRIEPRKNQLNFLRAMRGTNVPIVILGDAVPGHEDTSRLAARPPARLSSCRAASTTIRCWPAPMRLAVAWR